ncbi:MAG: hypothetical protein JST82_03515 [Bacteroidetes bacterium]|nr:hypothetical protein [Bacteroidota bacterium]
MKLRIRGNSVRIRLTKSEVEAFGRDGHVEEETSFINGTLSYVLQRYDGEHMSASVFGNKITMQIPEAQAKEWVETNKVGFEYNQPLPDGNTLYLLLEKDFKCLDENITEDQSDSYDNPLLQHKHD